MALTMDGFFNIMMFMAMLAAVITGLLTVSLIDNPDDPGHEESKLFKNIFSSVDLVGMEYAVYLMEMDQQLSVHGMFEVSTAEQTSVLGKAIQMAVSVADFLVTMGVRIVLWVATLVANFASALNLMIYPLKFIFDIFGVGYAFNAIAKTVILAAMTTGMGYIITRLAIFLWKGA